MSDCLGLQKGYEAMKTKEDKNLADREIEKVSGGQIGLDKDNTEVSLYKQNGTKPQKWILEED